MGVVTRFAYLIGAGEGGIRGIGTTKAAHIIYGAVEYLTSQPTFAEFGDQLVASCRRKSGTRGITSDDCAQVQAAAAEVGMITIDPPNSRGGSSYIVRDPSTRRARLVNGQNVHEIQSGSTFNCLARTRYVWDIPTLSTLNAPIGWPALPAWCTSAGDTWTYTSTAAGGNVPPNTILRVSGQQSWLVNADGALQVIIGDGTYKCLARRYPVIWDFPQTRVDSWPSTSPDPATCGGALGD